MPRPRIENKKIHKTLRIRKNDLEKIEEYCNKYNITRNEFIEKGIKLFIKKLESGVIDV